MSIRYTLLLLLSLSYTAEAPAASKLAVHSLKPSIQLASTLSEPISQLSDYLISEKLDGVRGYWDGKTLYSRSGRKIAAPAWFTAGFPDYALDGELWITRGAFEQVSAIVRKSSATDKEWQSIRFMVFDLPDEKVAFELRYQKAVNELSDISPYLQVLEQYSLRDQKQLDSHLQVVIAEGGEGLMLHKKSALYQVGRSQDIVKLKPFYDAEATVIAHKVGKGKYSGMLGALVVENKQGKIFKLGSGFTDAERLNPPRIGSLVTYKYYGVTQKGTPRFASFLRVREAH
ncbi:DNA ligase [Shewanella fidelis]|uniref:DNA ligase n=1 Tax=Shewanella fidelis TaxID=173509 RepID=A0AAW8NPA5_9GAMM|nr:DNA ligase [Shewanella fidelis]MDR8524175.1 DNA ligase [Shewanella fidelis]MDW4810722.1 DNA ligase [Shewanella fidelis]MDW4814843.1 DNA ligase [Shewanella fidelis]MDW4818933.1 DNA ligase [Shewanella fidelis]MDW4823390.1 DNA ligase [Shewanella fidelis]